MSRGPLRSLPQRSFFGVTNHGSSSQKKDGRETAKSCRFVSAKQTSEKILEFLIYSIDIWRHQFMLCSSEEGPPKGIGKIGNREIKVGKCGVAAMSERCRGDNVL